MTTTGKVQRKILRDREALLKSSIPDRDLPTIG
jgi:hypothetical protein